MRVTAESTANLGTTKVKNVCFIITYSQCDISHLSRAEFADIIVDAWVAVGSTQWAGISEAHGKGDSHFHTANKLSTRSRWRAVGMLENSKYLSKYCVSVA
jgi:hypothetical protein